MLRLRDCCACLVFFTLVTTITSKPKAAFGVPPKAGFGIPPKAGFGFGPSAGFGVPPKASFGFPPSAGFGFSPKSSFGFSPTDSFGFAPPWASYAGKSVYARSLGPPMTSGMDTISVPYMPKTSPFFPKFVDPKMMISKKTDFLSNLFGGVGPVNYPMTDSFPSKFGPSSSAVYARDVESEPTQDLSDLKNILESDKSESSQVNNEFKRGLFGPVGSQFMPTSPKFGPMNPFVSQFMPSFALPFGDMNSKFGFGSAGPSSRKKRSILSTVTSPPSNIGPPPPYPGLSPIAEESDAASDPSTIHPSMYGSFGPYGAFGPVGPMVDPSIFISKKTAFLNALFSSLATSTPATLSDIPTPKSTIVPPGFWSPFEATTATPVPKSTIVPPGFWLPSSFMPAPGEYNAKVATFLDKLFESIKLNKTKTPDSAFSANKIARSLGLEPEDQMKMPVKRSIEDLETITAAKDAIVQSIIAELGSLKTEMYNNLNDLIMSQKLSASSMSKKPMKPMKAAFAGLWSPAIDYTMPFQQKMAALSQVFDTLTELQKNITLAVSDAIKNSATTTESSADNDVPYQPQLPSNYLFNVTLLDAVKGKLADMEQPKPDYQPMPFWMTYAKPGTMKRNADNDYQDDYENNNDHDDRMEQFKRAVKMSMHQGYQSMPPGAVESVQAGGGSVPGHQGGGIKLLDSAANNEYESWNKWSELANNFDKPYEQRHHHNHH